MLLFEIPIDLAEALGGKRAVTVREAFLPPQFPGREVAIEIAEPEFEATNFGGGAIARVSVTGVGHSSLPTYSRRPVVPCRRNLMPQFLAAWP